MQILIPGTSDQITWSIQNLQDTTPYYVRVVIRDVKTETILKTLDLTDLGNGRFSGVWNVPQDGSGFGREIEFEKTVYEDSGYTTPSGVYGRWLDRALIFNLANRLPSTGGYGGHGTDYKEIARIIKKEVENAVETLKQDENKKIDTPIDLSPILQSLKTLSSGLSGLANRITAMETKDDDTHAEFDRIIEDVMSIEEKLQSVIKSSNEDVVNNVKNEVVNILERIENTEKVNKADLVDFEKKVDKELTYMVKTLRDVMDYESKKLQDHVEDVMKKPLNVTLAAHANAVKEQKTENPRDQQIKRLIG